MSIVSSYTIFFENLAPLEKLVERLNKKADKLGVEHILLQSGNKRHVPNADGVTVDTFVDVTITGSAPKLNGWEFVATLDHTQDDEGNTLNVLRTLPSFEGVLPEEFRTSTPDRCDQCHIARYRVSTYVIYNESLNKWAQVGSTCLADFLGHKNPHAVAAQAEMYLMLCDSCKNWSENGGKKKEDVIELDAALSWAAEAMLRKGWLSRTKARDNGGYATADVALDGIRNFKNKIKCTYRCGEPCSIHFEPSEKAVEMAHAVLEWSTDFIERELERNSSDYLWNLRVVLGSQFVGMRSFGLAISILGAYQRELARKAIEDQARRNSPSEYIGEIGSKLEGVHLKLDAYKYIATDFGTSTLITYHDDNNNVVKWFASGSHTPTVGETGTYTFTVKRHTEFGGIKETMVNRLVPYLTPEQVRARKAAQKAAKNKYDTQKALAEEAWTHMQDATNEAERLAYNEAYRTAADLSNKFHKEWKAL